MPPWLLNKWKKSSAASSLPSLRIPRATISSKSGMNANCHSITEIDATALSSELQFVDTVNDRSSTLVMHAGGSVAHRRSRRVAAVVGRSRRTTVAVDGRSIGRVCLAPLRSIYLRGVERPPARSWSFVWLHGTWAWSDRIEWRRWQWRSLNQQT